MAACDTTNRRKDFSHVANFTGYMATVFELVCAGAADQRILDFPAGNGLLSDRLRERGHDVVSADINRERPDYTYADLNERLPFEDSAFDTCLCLEGIEHVIDPAIVIAELCRITKPGGRIIVSVPNVQNAFSRFEFLCCGFFYQFEPWMGRHTPPGVRVDRGHIAPLTYVRLRYLFQHYGARLTIVSGDRWKKKWLIPVVLPFLAIGWIWSRRGLSREGGDENAESQQILRDLVSAPALFSRSLILVFEKSA